MSSENHTELALRVDPVEMLQYVYALTSDARGASAAGDSSPVARAAQLRWSALNRAFGDKRLDSWTVRRRAEQIHVPAALIAAAGVAPLTMAADEIVFDIPALLDTTLQLCEPAGNA